ncbi:MAG: hypothetical protein ABIJ45_01435 [Candidatus Zixiibacteriota bacterium]
MIMTLSAAGLMAGDAGRESPFSIGPTVRSSALGGGLVGLADGASNIFYNQAALATLDYQEVNLMHSTLFESSIYDVASYIYPTARAGSFGITFMRLGTGDIIRRTDWLYDDKFDYAIQQFIVGYGRKVEGGFYLGGALKLVNQSMDRNSTYGVGADISFYKPINNRLSFGLMFQDIIPARLKLDEELEATPYNVLIGMGLKNIEIVESISSRFNFAIEVPEERSAKIHTGIEASYRDWLDIRMGYDRDNFAFGFGVTHKNIKFNYTYRLMDGLTDSHRFGFSFYIGSSISARIRREIELESARGSYLILDDRRKQFENYRDIADNYYKANNLDSAFAYYQRALAYRQDDEEVTNKIDTINQIRMVEIAKLQEKTSADELKAVLLNGYYTQAERFYNDALFTSSLGVIETALNINPADYRFINLRDKNNRAIEDKIAMFLDSARAAEKDGRFTEAVINYNKILDFSPGDETVQRLVSRIGTAIKLARLISEGAEAFYKDEFDKAAGIFRSVQQIDRGNIIAEEFLLQMESAKKTATEQKDLENDSVVWQKYLNALEYYQNGEYQRAIDLWEEVLKAYPGNEKTIENIKQARLRLQSD